MGDNNQSKPENTPQSNNFDKVFAAIALVCVLSTFGYIVYKQRKDH